MYTIIPLLLAHVQELNKQILFKSIVKNIPLNLESDKYESLFSHQYKKIKVYALPKIIFNEKNDVHCPYCNAPHFSYFTLRQVNYLITYL